VQKTLRIAIEVFDAGDKGVEEEVMREQMQLQATTVMDVVTTTKDTKLNTWIVQHEHLIFTESIK
jgi:hypothetical protein